MNKIFRWLVASGVFFLAAVDAVAQYPAQPIRMIVPFPAGGPTDIVARPLAQMLGDALKVIVIVDNRGGAGGSVGAELVARAVPDGYTLLMATVGTNAINPSLYKKLPYDAVKDFTPIALVAAAPLAIVVHPSLATGDLAAVVARAKQMPGKLSYGSAGNGTPGHLTGESFKRAAGIDIQHVPYKGSAPALTDLIGGQIPVMFDPLQSVVSHVRSGKLRAVAVSSAARSPAVPNIPTVAESGYKGFEFTAWWGVFAPATLPTPLSVTLAGEIERIVRGNAFRDRMTPLGVLPTVLTLGKFGEFQRIELNKWSKAVGDSGATID
ncbi:MAG: tripartite tricarboxylate transporter substrate binding protein [Burkholderiales bacterium]